MKQSYVEIGWKIDKIQYVFLWHLEGGARKKTLPLTTRIHKSNRLLPTLKSRKFTKNNSQTNSGQKSRKFMNVTIHKSVLAKKYSRKFTKY